MSLFKNKESAEFKYTVSQTFLTSDDMSAFIDAVVQSVINAKNIDDEDVLHYVIKHEHINQFTMAFYLDVESKKKAEDEENIYNVIRDIKAQIYMDQYLDILEAINEGIKYELHKKTANFGLGDLGDPAEMMVQLEGLIKQIQTDPKIQKVVDSGILDTATKKAQAEVKKEQKTKKAKKIVSE